MQYGNVISNLSQDEMIRLIEAYQSATNQIMFCSITDLDGIIVYANDYFCKISQYTREELIGQNHNIVNAHYHPNEFFEEMWNTISSGNTWHGEVKNRAKDGSFFWLDSVIIPIRDEHNKINQYFSLRTLITDRKQAEEELESHISALENMLYILSHKVRHPIANIMSIVSLLEDYADSPEEILKMAAYVKESALTLDSFTRELTELIGDFEKEVKQLRISHQK